MNFKTKLYALYSKDNSFVEMFYRQKEVKVAGADNWIQLQYKSFAGLWQGTMSDNQEGLLKSLVEITPEQYEKLTGQKYIEYEHC